MKLKNYFNSYILHEKRKKLLNHGLISHIVYQRNCVKKSHASNVTWRAFNAFIGLNVVKCKTKKLMGT